MLGWIVYNFRILMKKALIAVVVLAVLAAGGWYVWSYGVPMPPQNEEETGSAVAVVNGEELSRQNLEALEAQIAASQGVAIASLDAQTRTQLRAQAVETLVSQVLLRQAAESAGVVPTAAEVDAQVTLIKEQFESVEAFAAALAAQSITEAELRTQVSTELTTQAYLEQQLKLSALTATEEEVDAAYETLAAAEEDAPALEEVREQIENFVIQQKQQRLLEQLLQRLRAEAQIEILV